MEQSQSAFCEIIPFAYSLALKLAASVETRPNQ